MKQNYRMTLQYEGTKYNGWQKQGNTPNTIQAKLEAILQKLDGTEVEVRGSGRTDGGVHAMGQVASFSWNIPCLPVRSWLTSISICPGILPWWRWKRPSPAFTPD